MGANSFAAIDVETANADMASICQVGIAKYKDGQMLQEWKSYVNPDDYFDPFNISIHGIDESVVEGAPTFPDLAEVLYSHLDGAVVVCHTHFDRVAIHQAAERYSIRFPNSVWLDSAKVARRAWTKFAWKGYGLHNVCKELCYDFKHHDALEDAKAAAHVLLSAMIEGNLDVEGWLERVKQPIANSGSPGQPIKRRGNPEGTLYGEILVFTGALQMPRRQAAGLAASVGCQVSSGVTKNTTILVVGDHDIKRLSGHGKSSKHRKAEELIANGVPIRIIGESDFKELVRLSDRDV
jgi:DNA polymerase-3 subunit epsilon